MTNGVGLAKQRDLPSQTTTPSLIEMLECALTTDGFRWPKDQLYFPKSHGKSSESRRNSKTADTKPAEMKTRSRHIIRIKLPKNDGDERESERKVESCRKRKLESSSDARKRSRVEISSSLNPKAEPNITKELAAKQVSSAAAKASSKPQKKSLTKPPWFVRLRKERNAACLLRQARPDISHSHHRLHVLGSVH